MECDMTTTPDGPAPDDDQARELPLDDPRSVGGDEPAGAEIGISEGEGSTFEPEEDAGAQS